MKKIFFLYAIVSVLFSCNSEKKDTTQKEPKLINSTTFNFSNKEKADTFKVELTKGEIKNSKVIFTITNADNQQIYKREFISSDLLKAFEASKNLKQDDEKFTFLKTYIADFFEEQHFLEPALTPQDVPDKNVDDKKFYNELQKSELNGFEFRISEDKKYYIAWSVTDNKVKIYYQCC